MKYLIILLLLTTLSSCEGYFKLKGKVLDSNSGAPIGNARFTFIIEEKDTTLLRCTIIERDTIPPKERIKLRKKNIADSFKGRDQTGFYKYYDTLIHPDGSFNLGSRLFNVMTGFPKAKLVVSSEKYNHETLIVDNPNIQGIIIRLVKNQ